MKKSLLIIGLFALAVVFGCSNEKEQQAREKQIHDSFAQLMSAKDTELEGLFQELNEIDASLTDITNQYSKVSSVANTSGETSKDTKANIKEKIQTINDLLAENKRKVANVNSRLQKNNKENEHLKAFVQNLESRIKEQEEQIQALNSELAKKNAQIDNLNKDVADLNEKAKQRDAQIMKIEDEKNLAYFVIGTKKELMQKNIIDRKGGFIGIGRSSVLSTDADYSNFTKIDIRNTQEIALTGKKIEIITSHPASSYSLEGDQKAPTSIRIINPEEFWRGNRCLIIRVN
jgi:peptidoglycan hydrolase CwlO-like protein